MGAASLHYSLSGAGAASSPTSPREASKAIWDLDGIWTTSRHVPGIRFIGNSHPGLFGCAPSPTCFASGTASRRPSTDAAVGAPPRPARLLVNVTPIGMAGGPQEHDLSFARELVEQAEVVFDVVAFPPDTPLVRLGADPAVAPPSRAGAPPPGG